MIISSSFKLPLYQSYPRFCLYAGATAFVLLGMVEHAAIVGAENIYKKAALCDRLKCQEIAALQKDVREFDLPTKGDRP